MPIVIQNLENPLYEVGIQYPINPATNQIFPNINLPIPKNVTFYREFKAGDTLPVYLKTTGNVVELTGDPQQLKLLTDIFVRVTKTDVYFSLNQRDWLPFNQIFSGQFNASVGLGEDDNPRVLVHLFADIVGS